MKKVFVPLFVVVIMLGLLLSGCTTEKKITFKNIGSDQVFDKTIQFILLSGWKIRYENREAKSIQAVLGEYTSTSSSSHSVEEMDMEKDKEKGKGKGKSSKSKTKSSYEHSSGSITTKTNFISFVFTEKEKDVEVFIRADSEEWLFWSPDETIKEYEEFVTGVKKDESE
jgi:hypothetical protein